MTDYNLRKNNFYNHTQLSNESAMGKHSSCENTRYYRQSKTNDYKTLKNNNKPTIE